MRSVDGIGNPFRGLPSLDGVGDHRTNHSSLESVGNPFRGMPSLDGAGDHRTNLSSLESVGNRFYGLPSLESVNNPFYAPPDPSLSDRVSLLASGLFRTISEQPKIDEPLLIKDKEEPSDFEQAIQSILSQYRADLVNQALSQIKSEV